MVDRSRTYPAIVAADRRRCVLVAVPFDPDEVWGKRPEHHVAGTVNGLGVRAVIQPRGDGYGILLGPMREFTLTDLSGDYLRIGRSIED